MNATGFAKNTRLLRRAGALAVGAVLAACSGSGDANPGGAPAATQASPTASAVSASKKDPKLEAWHEVLSTTHPPKTGCFHASYPSTDWVEVPCVPAPEEEPIWSPRAPVPAPSPRAQEPKDHARQVPTAPAPSSGGDDNVGGGTDWFALLSGSGQIWKATGSFPSVSTGISLSTGYSIQLNTNVFKLAYGNSLCGPTVASCEGAQQAVYSASTGGLNFEYVLVGAGSACPSGWNADSNNNCYHRSNSVPGVPLVGISDLSSINMTLETGSSDWLVMTIEGSAYSEYFPSVLNITGWNSVQFGVYGDDDGHEAIFNSPNTTIVTHIDTMTTSGSGPITCSSKAGASGDGIVESTVEYNNLNLVPHCCLAENNGITFEESNNAAQTCGVCGGEGQTCCSVGNPTCASAGDVCYGGTCTACGGNGEPCCAGNTCSGGNTCQLGACGALNTLAASPSALSVQDGDGTTGANTAITYLEASGYWANNSSESPSLSFIVTGVPAGVALPTAGQMPPGVNQPVITNDINPPTVQFSVGTAATPGTYTFEVIGTIGSYSARTNVTLTVGACQPVTCAQAGWVCGSFDNGCGATATCGTCPSGESCEGGACYACAARTCPSGQHWDPTACRCEGCPCGYIIVSGHEMCAICR